jgi:hypothetical protein
MPKTTIKIDSQVLQPYREIAGILGMTVSRYLEGYLSQFGDTMRSEGLGRIGEEISDWPYETREEAQAVADRFEEFVIEAKLAGRPNIGTVAAEVVPTDDGGWTVKAHYLSPTGKGGWRSTSVLDDWNGQDDSY